MKSTFTKQERKLMITKLEEAARLLKRKQWIQGAEVELKDGGRSEVSELEKTDQPVGFCAIGALNYVEAPASIENALTDVMDRMFEKRSKIMRPLIAEAREGAYGERFRLEDNTPNLSIVEFNDEHAMSRRDILHVFRTAVKMLRNREI